MSRARSAPAAVHAHWGRSGYRVGLEAYIWGDHNSQNSIRLRRGQRVLHRNKQVWVLVFAYKGTCIAGFMKLMKSRRLLPSLEEAGRAGAEVGGPRCGRAVGMVEVIITCLPTTANMAVTRKKMKTLKITGRMDPMMELTMTRMSLFFAKSLREKGMARQVRRGLEKLVDNGCTEVDLPTDHSPGFAGPISSSRRSRIYSHLVQSYAPGRPKYAKRTQHGELWRQVHVDKRKYAKEDYDEIEDVPATVMSVR